MGPFDYPGVGATRDPASLPPAGYRLPRAPCEVVRSVREDDRVGFAHGTLPGRPECGEEAFVVERDADGTVRLSVTAFSRPALRYTRAAGPAVRLLRRAYAGRCGTVPREPTGQFDGK
ncbi:DUF1990 domain-containing protein [Streptomyces sp. NPDC059637]|uniref:DUF1990 domain-containing protein n=1 Tax=Streptomyces TaxID=1883 RepID=UPI0031D6F868